MKKLILLTFLFSLSAMANEHFVAVANSSLSVGDVVSMHYGYNGKVDKFDATSSDRPLGVVEFAASASAPVSVLTSGVISWSLSTSSEEEFAHPSTPGAITLTKPNSGNCWSIGMRLANNQMLINPQPCHP